MGTVNVLSHRKQTNGGLTVPNQIRTLLVAKPGGDTLALVVASALAGVGALIFILVGTRSLGLEEFAAVSQLWTLWAISYAVITFSTQQSVIRSWHTGRRIQWFTVMMPSLITAAIATPILVLRAEDLFASQSVLWPVAGAIIPFGSLLTGLTRGRLAARGDTSRLAIVVGGENTLRAVLAIVLAVLGLDAAWYAIAVIGGFAVAGVGFFGGRDQLTQVVSNHYSRRNEARLDLAASLGGLSSHVLLVLAPAVLALAAVPAARVSAVFIVLALYRAPYQLILGLGPRVSSEMIARMPTMNPRDIRPMTGRFIGVTTVTAIVLSLSAALLGDNLISPIFGAEHLLQSADHGLAAALTIFAMASIVLTMALYALDDSTTILRVWPVLSVAGLIAISAVSGGVTATLAILVLTEVSVAISLMVGFWRRAHRVWAVSK